MMIGVSVALAVLSSAFAFIVKTLAGLKYYHILFGLLGAGVVVMLPITLIAMTKLRRQDLSSLLEGCGWAINARMRLARALRKRFTAGCPFPERATGTPRSRVLWVILAIVVIGGGLYHGVRALRSVLPADDELSADVQGNDIDKTAE